MIRFWDSKLIGAPPLLSLIVQRTRRRRFVALIVIDGCVYDGEQFALSHGYESLDPVGREAFVNHLHLGGYDRALAADRKIRSWIAEMLERWPDQPFRIYRQVEDEEVTIRFHAVRPDLPNWCEVGVEIITVNG